MIYTLLVDIDNVGIEQVFQLFRGRALGFALSRRSIYHNIINTRESLYAWGRQQISLGYSRQWNRTARDVRRPAPFQVRSAKSRCGCIFI